MQNLSTFSVVKDMNAICPKLRAWILLEASHRTAKSLFRRGEIPIRSGERYVAEFRDGGNWQKKEYLKRIIPKQSPQIIT